MNKKINRIIIAKFCTSVFMIKISHINMQFGAFINLYYCIPKSEFSKSMRYTPVMTSQDV